MLDGKGSLRFRADRERLLLEVHARPSTPIEAPSRAARIVTLSGEDGEESDRAHMARLCARYKLPAPGATARWCVLDAGAWSLRWERHTEVSAWTVFRRGAGDEAPQSALAEVPEDWIASLPGEVLVATHANILKGLPSALPFAEADVVASAIAPGGLSVYTDFRAGPDAFTRFLIVSEGASDAALGRFLQQVFEVETYRLLALLALPVALDAVHDLKRIEAGVDEAAAQVVSESGVEADRLLLDKLASLAGEAERLAGQIGFRLAASQAYYGLVTERIGGWREQPLKERLTLGEFMERRLGPAIRTCAAVGERQRRVVERIARAVQILSARVGVASERVNVELLASMDRRSRAQLRLQQTVEGLSIVAVSYYAVALIKFLFEGLAEAAPSLNATVATAVAAPFVVGLVWFFLRGVRERLFGERETDTDRDGN